MSIARVRLSAVALAVVLASCSSGSTDTTTPYYPPQTGTITGKMIDDPIQGLNYATSPDPVNYPPRRGDFGRLTGPNGEYQYNPGDVVYIQLGTMVLATASRATGIVSPIEMAHNAGGAVVLQNMLTLFQSLDVDGNPFNGIVIPPAAAELFTQVGAGTVFPNNLGYLSQDPAVFASSANTLLVRAQQAAGITTGIISPARASTTFLRQFLQLVSVNVWATADATTFALIRADTTGRYIMGQASPSDAAGHAGVETGRIPAAGFDTFGWVWSKPTLTIDTNGEWGLSHLKDCERAHVLGDVISFNDCTGAAEGSIPKADNDATGITGVWALGGVANPQVLTFVFFPNGKFGVVDPTGSTAVPSCGGPGVEYGSYTYDASTKILKVSGLTYDTDGCAGLSGTAAATAAGLTFTLSGDGKTATYNDGTARTMYRVSQ